MTFVERMWLEMVLQFRFFNYLQFSRLTHMILTHQNKLLICGFVRFSENSNTPLDILHLCKNSQVHITNTELFQKY